MINVHSNGRVVVGVDGSSGSLLALEFAYDEAHARGVDLLVVGVAEIPEVWSHYYGIAMTEPNDNLTDHLDRKLRASVQEILGERMTRNTPGGPDVQVAVCTGGAASTLTTIAEGSPLLVVGTRGLGGFRRVLLGSVSLLCALHAPCPVAVVRPTTQRVEETTEQPATATPAVEETVR